MSESGLYTGHSYECAVMRIPRCAVWRSDIPRQAADSRLQTLTVVREADVMMPLATANIVITTTVTYIGCSINPRY